MDAQIHVSHTCMILFDYTTQPHQMFALKALSVFHLTITTIVRIVLLRNRGFAGSNQGRSIRIFIKNNNKEVQKGLTKLFNLNAANLGCAVSQADF